MLEKHKPKEDAAAVARLEAAGVIIIGKTNMPDSPCRSGFRSPP
jgi:Asp-tRNA(Asn)/Glu-tRNA(Gln) amidotransferase A subunit family amidase